MSRSRAPSTPHASSPFRERNNEIGRLRAALLEIASDLDLFRFITDSDPTSQFPDANAIIATTTVEELLGILANEWDPETHPHQAAADPNAKMAKNLRAALLAFGETFDIFVVSDAATSSNDQAIVRFMDEEWHATSGCFNHMPSPNEVRLIERKIARNLQMLTALSDAILEIPPVRLRPALRRFRDIDLTLWCSEARHLAKHSILSWIPDIHEHKITERALRAARNFPENHGWSPEDAHEFLRMMNDAFYAVLTYEIAHRPITEALYEPIEPILPLSSHHRKLLD